MHDKKIKVGILIDQLIPGGVQKIAINETKNLQMLGFDTKLIILMRKGFQKKNSYLVKNLKYEFISDRYPKILQINFKFPIFRFLSASHLINPVFAPFYLDKNNFDLIISHGSITSLTTYSLSVFRNIPYFAIIHDPMYFILGKIYSTSIIKYSFPLIKPIILSLDRLIIRRAKVCFVDSRVHATFIEEKYRVKPEILHLGVNPINKIPKKRGEDILTFGRWDAGKNLQFLTDVTGNFPHHKLVIAGSWTSHKELNNFRSFLTTNGLNNSVKLITGYKETDLAKICETARVWVHPNFEAFSLSALEAASYGLPIIIPSKSGVTELFKNSQHGFFPKNISVQEFKKPIAKLLKNERLAYKIGLQAANIVRLNNNSNIRAQHLSRKIQEVLHPKFEKFIALETAHVGKTGLAGGDILLVKMLEHAKISQEINVIITKTKLNHWNNNKIKANLIPTSAGLLSNSTNHIIVITNYLLRSINNFFILRKISARSIVYSSTEILPDVLPAFFVKLTKKNIFWIARIHHLWLPTVKRPGKHSVNFFSNAIQSILLKVIKNKADLILALNPVLKNELIKRDFNNSRIAVLGGGVDFEAFSNFKIEPAKHFDGIFVGRIHPVKGVFDLPVIWKHVTEIIPSASLIIIGPGTNETVKKLRTQIANLKIEKNISYLGFLPESKIISSLKNSKVFLFCDHEAGFGLAVAEAMAAGCPVVGYDIGILGSVYKKGFVRTPPFDSKIFAKVIINILTNKKIYNKLSYEAVLQAKKLDWKITSQKFEDILNKATLNPPSPTTSANSSLNVSRQKIATYLKANPQEAIPQQ